MGKKPKLTKEERRARKKAKKEAARLRRIQKAIQDRKDFLDRETKATALNETAVKKKWREIMKKVRAPMLYDDFVALKQRHQGLMDMKDMMIEELMDALEDANEQSNMNLQNHVDTIDKLLRVFAGRMEHLNSWYRDELEALGQSMGQEKSHINQRQRTHELQLNVVVSAMQQIQDQHTMHSSAERSYKADDAFSKGAEAYHRMQTYLEDTLQRQWDELQSTLQTHQKSTEARRGEVAVLRRAEEDVHNIISTQARRMKHLQRQIWKSHEWLQTFDQSETMKTVLYLRRERDDLKSTYLTLRSRMEAGLRLDANQTKVLVVLSEGVIKWLKALHAKGERIITQVALCRPMETLEEKLDAIAGMDADADEDEPQPADTDDRTQRTSAASKAEQKERSLQEVETEEDMFEEVAASVAGLGRFWARAGCAGASCIELRGVVEELRAENMELNNYLARYLRSATPAWAAWPELPAGAGPLLPSLKHKARA